MIILTNKSSFFVIWKKYWNFLVNKEVDLLNLSYLIWCFVAWVLRQLPSKENCPNPKTKPNSNPNPNQWTIFLGGNCLFASNPKINPNLDPDTNTNW